MKLGKLESVFGLKRHSRNMPALSADQQLEEIMNGGQAKRIKLFNEYKAKQCAIEAKMLMAAELKRPEASQEPPSPPEDVVVAKTEKLNPEDIRILSFLKRENKATLKLRMGGNRPRTVKKIIKQENGQTLSIFMDLRSSNHADATFPKLTDVIKCNICGDEFLNIIQLQEHLNKHMFSNKMVIKTEDMMPTMEQIVIKKEEQVTKKEAMVVQEEEKATTGKGMVVKEEKIEPETSKAPVNLPEALQGKIKQESLSPFAPRPQFLGRRAYQCSICGKRMNTEEVLRTHMAKYHPVKMETVSQKLSQCDVCGEMITCKNLKSHKLSHEDSDRVFCEYCERSYKRKQSLRAHIKKNHPNYYVPERRGGGRKK